MFSLDIAVDQAVYSGFAGKGDHTGDGHAFVDE
jgi:hypothetical protein